MRQLPLIRDAGPGDIQAVLGVYSACIAADAGYLPFLEAGDEPTVLAWFLLKPLLACLVAEQDGLVAGVAGLWDAAPGSRSGDARRTLARSTPPGRPSRAPQGRGHPGPDRRPGITRSVTPSRPPVDALRRRLPLTPARGSTRLDLVGTHRVRGTRRDPARHPADPNAQRPS
jgi:hypothetical protein